MNGDMFSEETAFVNPQNAARTRSLAKCVFVSKQRDVGLAHRPWMGQRGVLDHGFICSVECVGAEWSIRVRPFEIGRAHV